MPSTTPEQATRSLGRRIQLALFLSGFVDAVTVHLVALGVGLVVLRVTQTLAPAPQPFWWLLIIPAFVWGGVCARRGSLPNKACAVHLDRRLGLDGLLLASLERPSEDWTEALSERLEDLRGALPKLRVRRLFARLLPAAAFLAVILHLPPPESRSEGENTPLQTAAMRAALDQLAKELQRLDEEQVLPDERRAELEQRVAELGRSLQDGGSPSWSDIDGLEERILHELSLNDDTRQKLLAALRALTPSSAAVGPRDRAEAEQRLRHLSQALASAKSLGLLQRLPPELARELERLGGARQDALGAEGGKAGALTAEELAALRAALERWSENQHQESEACRSGQCVQCKAGALARAGLGSGAGFGGLSRGPGRAALNEEEHAGGRLSTTGGLMLPRGAPNGGVVIDANREEGEVAPERDTTVGGQGQGQRGATAARVRPLAPHHEAVVKRFFGARGATADVSGHGEPGGESVPSRDDDLPDER